MQHCPVLWRGKSLVQKPLFFYNGEEVTHLFDSGVAAMMLSLTTDKVRYIVDEHGKRSDVLLDYETWQEVLNALELLEDLTAARQYIQRRSRAASPEEMDLLPLPEALDEGNAENAGVD